MTSAVHTNTTAIGFSIEALRHRISAAELDIAALAAVRAADADLVQRTEAGYRGLIAKKGRYHRLMRELIARQEMAQ